MWVFSKEIWILGITKGVNLVLRRISQFLLPDSQVHMRHLLCTYSFQVEEGQGRLSQIVNKFLHL